MAAGDQHKPCPTCGTCPTCGRGPAPRVSPYWPRPYQPYYYPHQPGVIYSYDTKAATQQANQRVEWT